MQITHSFPSDFLTWSVCMEPPVINVHALNPSYFHGKGDNNDSPQHYGIVMQIIRVYPTCETKKYIKNIVSDNKIGLPWLCKNTHCRRGVQSFHSLMVLWLHSYHSSNCWSAKHSQTSTIKNCKYPLPYLLLFTLSFPPSQNYSTQYVPCCSKSYSFHTSMFLLIQASRKCFPFKPAKAQSKVLSKTFQTLQPGLQYWRVLRLLEAKIYGNYSEPH